MGHLELRLVLRGQGEVLLELHLARDGGDAPRASATLAEEELVFDGFHAMLHVPGENIALAVVDSCKFLEHVGLVL